MVSIQAGCPARTSDAFLTQKDKWKLNLHKLIPLFHCLAHFRELHILYNISVDDVAFSRIAVHYNQIEPHFKDAGTCNLAGRLQRIKFTLKER